MEKHSGHSQNLQASGHHQPQWGWGKKTMFILIALVFIWLYFED